MKRIEQNLNADWLYVPFDLKSAAKANCAEGKFVRVSLPHTNIELPYHNFSEQEHCFVSWYRKHFAVPKLRAGCRVFIDFDGVMIASTVFVNGKQVAAEHKGGYTPFSYDITDFVHPGRGNLMAVRVDSSERSDIPPYGGVVDYLTFGGIYRDVKLRLVDGVYIKHIFVRAGDVLSDRKKVDVSVRVVNTTEEARTVRLTARFGCCDTAAVTADVKVQANGEADADLAIAGLGQIERWDLDNPMLYGVSVALDNGDGVQTRVGFRTAEFREDGAFYLNDKPMKLRGLDRHQTFAYVGQAAPARMQRKDAEILKNDLACNIVRTSHYPQSPHFLDRCDEIGLLVLEEIPGWQHIGDEAWQAISVRDVETMITRDRNHASIILWGVGINESVDNHDFYTRTNALAHKLDPTRQTGGIRCIWNSELLEDVYTMNDFGYDLKPPGASRYLNTEFCGHMYPTKTFDQEERVKQHALHHAHVQNQIGGMKTAGGIGWCAFDYNTHAVFGSGDRICYHGVMDIFRQPKFAAFFYASQVEPQKRIVLEPGTYWKQGDKSGGGVEPLVIFGNVDEIEVFIGCESRGRFKPDRERYPNLPRPPFVIQSLGQTWGKIWADLRVVGYIDGKQAAERRVCCDGIPARLEMVADDKTLSADGADMTRISLGITDGYGNILPFAIQPVALKLRGPGVLVGENPFSMPGGRGAVYVRSTRKPGTITLTAETARLKRQKLTIRTKPA